MDAEGRGSFHALTVPTPLKGLGRVVVLDDDPECLQLASVALASAGFEVDACEGLKPFFEHLESGLPDALVLDRRFPGGSGEMLAVQLRVLLGRERPPVVLWTADPSRNTEAAMLSGFANDVVVKCQQGIDVLVRRVVNLVGWEYVGPGLMLKRREDFLLYRGERSKALTGREIDFVYQLCSAPGNGLTRKQGEMQLLDPGESDAPELLLNRVVNRFKKKLPPALRRAFKTLRGVGWKLEL